MILVTPIQEWKKELREIESRKYCYPLDYTRAAIIRACIKSWEGELMKHKG